MEVFFLFFLVLLIWMLSRVVPKAISELPQLRTGHPAHGHRCYSEGLNASEKKVLQILSHGLSHKEYFIFNNLILPLGNQSTQIDHIVVSRYGIFVIESKESNAWIFGDSHKKEWTTLYKSSKKYSLPNPLHQNHGHIMALKQLMPFIEGEDCFCNVVIFTGNCTFKTKRICNVLYDRELLEFMSAQKTEKISPQRLLMAIGKLSYLCQTADVTPEQHVYQITSKLKAKGMA